MCIRDRLKAAARPSSGDVQIASNASTSVLLAVTDTQVQKLFHVMKHGDWSLQLRPPLKANDSPESVAYVGSILTDGLSAGQLEAIRTGGTR